MTYEVRLAPQAIRDLRSLYLENQAATSHHAATWFRGLEAAVFSLDTFPHRGSTTPEDKSLRHLLYGDKPHIYRIIYSVDDQSQTVNVAQIRHGAREPLPTRNT
jgi:mRNA-degrading endonuclease RelE of RelBE toxin-antitoxin system